MKYRPRKIGSFIFLSSTLFLLAACESGEQAGTAAEEKDSSNAQSVEIVNPAPRKFTADIVITGKALANQSVKVFAMESGYVERIHKDIGDKVKANELIAELTNPELNRKSQKAVAIYNAKKATYDRLNNSYKKTPSLVPMQMLENAKGESLAAFAEMNGINERILYLKIRAPFDGVITKRFVDKNSLVQSGINDPSATPVIEVQDPNPIRLSIQMTEGDAAAIQIGMVAKITFPDLPGTEFPAKISRTAAAVDPASGTMQVQIDIDNEDGKIKPGMYAQARIRVNSRDNVMSLPLEAQFIQDDGFFLLVVEKNIVTRIPLRRGLSNKTHFEVLNSEITAASKVIVQGKSRVKVGTPVEAIMRKEVAENIEQANE